MAIADLLLGFSHGARHVPKSGKQRNEPAVERVTGVGIQVKVMERGQGSLSCRSAVVLGWKEEEGGGLEWIVYWVCVGNSCGSSRVPETWSRKEVNGRGRECGMDEGETAERQLGEVVEGRKVW